MANDVGGTGGLICWDTNLEQTPLDFGHQPTRFPRPVSPERSGYVSLVPKKPLPRKHTLSCALQVKRHGVIPATISKHFRGRMCFSLRRQDERKYNQPGQQHARDKRKRRMQRVCLKMAASFCPPVYRGVHGSLLPARSTHIHHKGTCSRLNQKAPTCQSFW